MSNTHTSVEATHLSYQDPASNSDKVYHVFLTDLGNGTFQVTAEFGRRGSALQFTDKGIFNSRAEADRMYLKTVRSKTAKGYAEFGSGPVPTAAPAAPTRPANKSAKTLPQLLTPIDDPSPFIDSAAWALQEKMDGVRLLVRYDDTTQSLTAYNRTGGEIPVPASLAELKSAIEDMGASAFTLDGEFVNDAYHVFDLLDYGTSLDDTYVTRYGELGELVERIGLPALRVVPNLPNNGMTIAQLRDRKAEGVVFKRLSARHKAGRGSDQYKLKFWKSVTCIVTHHNRVRSVGIGLLDEAQTIVPAGNVTVKANQQLPAVDSLVEVKYLYATRAGVLYQPELLAERQDIQRTEAVASQLHYAQGVTA